MYPYREPIRKKGLEEGCEGPSPQQEKEVVPSSCVVLIDGRKYDVTLFVKKHPGGIKSITSYHGKDASAVFHRLHGKKAHGMLTQFLMIE